MVVSRAIVSVWLVVGVLASTAAAVEIETVPVGDPGNLGEWSGQSYGGSGFDRVCGAVDYTYNIGKYEVTAGQYTAFLNAVAGVDTYRLYSTTMVNTFFACGITRRGGGTTSDPYTYSVGPAFVNRPVNYVSWGDAARFANWLHNGQPTGAQGLATTEDGAYFLNGATTDVPLEAVARKASWKWAIATEDEWYKAAYYKGGSTNAGYFDYPTSSDTAPGQDMSDASGNNANYYTSPYISPIDAGKCTTVVGEFQNSESPYGTFDQGGNVDEWTETAAPGRRRILRGGYADGSYRYLQASSRDHGIYAPINEDGSIGFRVVQVPEPTTVAMLAWVSMGIIRRGRKNGQVRG